MNLDQRADILILNRNFMYRHTTSRRDLTSAEVASSVDLYLEKQDAGRSSTVQISLTEPGLVAVRTRLQFRGGTKAFGDFNNKHLQLRLFSFFI